LRRATFDTLIVYPMSASQPAARPRLPLAVLLLCAAAAPGTPSAAHAETDPQAEFGASAQEESYTRFRYEHSKVVTRDPYPVLPGRFQLSVFYLFEEADRQWDDRWAPADRARTDGSAGVLVFSAGLARGIDASILTTYTRITDEETFPGTVSGIQNISVLGTMAFYQNPDRTVAIAYVPSMIFPLGPESTPLRLGTTEGTFGYDNRVSFSIDFAGNWTTTADFGYVQLFGAEPGETWGFLSTNAGIGYQAASWLQPIIEISYAHGYELRSPDTDAIAVLGGVLLPLPGKILAQGGVQQFVAGRNADIATRFIFGLKVTF